MKNKVYENTLKGIGEFIADIDDSIFVHIKAPKVLRKDSMVKYIGHSVPKNKYNAEIKPIFNFFLNKEKNSVITVQIPEYTLGLSLAEGKSERSLYFSFKMESTRISVEVSSESLKKYLDNFYDLEKPLADIVQQRIKEQVNDLFTGKITCEGSSFRFYNQEPYEVTFTKENQIYYKNYTL